MSEAHTLIVILGALIVAVIFFGSIHLNVRYNRVQPYFLRGFMVSRLVGVAAGIICCLAAYGLSRFW